MSSPDCDVPVLEAHGDDPRAAAALARLFRRSLVHGSVNPLMALLRRYHGVSAALGVPAPLAPATQVQAPRAPVTSDELMHAVIALPSMPQAVQDALAALQNEDISVAAITECIEHDQAMVVRILRVANTAFYGAPGRIGTIHVAISVLGLRAVSALLTAAAVVARFPADAKIPLDFKQFWRHALTTAVIARELAPAIRLDADVAFTAALLHDIGSLVLATSFPAAYAVARKHAEHADLPLWQAERLVMGLDHGSAGELLAHRWHLPPAIIGAIGEHHVPPMVADAEGATLTELVHLADALAHGISLERGAEEVVPEFSVELWSRLDIDPEVCLSALRSSGEAVDALCEALVA